MKTSISINGEQYPLFEAIGQASLGDLAVVNKRGVNPKTIKAAFERVLKRLNATADGEEEFDGLDLYEDDDYIQNMIGVVFLALRHAGHDITIDDAARVPGTAVFLVMEEDDEADPKDEGELPPTSRT